MLFKGNLYDKKLDYHCFTSNSFINKYDGLVMGRGNALYVKKKFKDIDLSFGKRIKHLSKFGIVVDENNKIVAVQTKIHYIAESPLDLIEFSLTKLKEFAVQHPTKTIGLPYPGIGLGCLTIPEVQPLIDKLPSNVRVYTLENKTYTGIGSRNVPSDIYQLMIDIARYLEEQGYNLRSGGAQGSDTAFEVGVSDEKNESIYLPWKGFNGSKSNLIVDNPLASKVAQEHHPIYDRLSRPVKKLMNRNTCQVLGYELNSISDFLICWTRDGSRVRTNKSGGTGQALSIAKQYGVKVYNLCNKEDRKYWEKKINESRNNKLPK